MTGWPVAIYFCLHGRHVRAGTGTMKNFKTHGRFKRESLVNDFRSMPQTLVLLLD
jgi:hypothetical protein